MEEKYGEGERMIKWLSSTIVIIGLLCGQIFAEDILKTPIDYFGDKKAAREAAKLQEKKPIDITMQSLVLQMQKLNLLMIEQKKTMEDIKKELQDIKKFRKTK